MTNPIWSAGALERVEAKAQSFADEAQWSIAPSPSRARLYDKTVWAAGALSAAAGAAAGAALVASSRLGAGAEQMALVGAYAGAFSGLGGIFIGALAGESILHKAGSLARSVADWASARRQGIDPSPQPSIDLEAFRARRSEPREPEAAPAKNPNHRAF